MLMRIRHASPADVPAVLPMVAQICALHEAWDADKYGFLPNPAERYRRWLEQQATSDRSIFLLVEQAVTGQDISEDNASENDAVEHQQANKFVAFLVATIETEIPLYRLKEFGFIHDLWVEPAYRQLGLGKQLVEQTLQAFQHKGISQVRLDTAIANEAARRLFQSCGFRLSTIELLATINHKHD